MPNQTLTDLAIRRLSPPKQGTKTYWDATTRGLGIRVSQGGAKTFIVLVGSGRRRKVGRYPTLTLSEARTEAKRMLAELTLGKSRPSTIAFSAALERFLLDCNARNRPRTVSDYRRLLNRHFPFRARRLADITTQEISARLSHLKHTPSEANHAFVAARVFFRWAVRQKLIDQSPCADLQLPAKPRPKDRVLTDDELKSVYSAALSMGFPFGCIVRLLILTGQRRGEIGALEWQWIGDDTVTLPAYLTKNGRQHTFPLSLMTRKLLNELPQFQSPYVFPASRSHVGGKPTKHFNGWQKGKLNLDQICPIQPWTLHDLRRTFATNLAALSTPIHITERLLNHVSGTQAGIVSVYQRHSYMDEMCAAIDAWEARLARILEETPKPA